MITATDVVRALGDDRNRSSGWVTSYDGREVTREEVWLQDAGMWVRANGRWVSGWKGETHFGRRFGLFAAFRIRRAVRRWASSETKQGIEP